MNISTGTTTVITFGYTFQNGMIIGKDNTDVLFVTFQVSGKTVLEKDINDIEFNDENGTFIVTLSQEDTISVGEKKHVEIQWRARLKDGTALKSNVIKAESDQLLKDGVI